MKHARQPGRHRVQHGRRRAEPPGKRRAAVRPRYGRIAVMTASATVTGIAVLGGFGLLPSGPEDASAAAGGIAPAAAEDKAEDKNARQGEQRAQVRSAPAPSQDRTVLRSTPGSEAGRRTTPPATTEPSTPALPPDSGTGRRVVFSESAQRVWLVAESGEVERTYLASGSAYDNLEPGTYAVYSRSRYAVGVDNSGTMEYFARFTQGDEGGAIGFHTIPVDDGEPVQTVADLGTPLSHGCIRQRTADAVALWNFAPIGTTVVVTP
ncbi:L,D-transpeptidase [Nocardioides antri]|uniref:L,D-transpeptidase family protein n=1 Tax=Nocardioides antri TaxID=2607659 RepID=A0A5B1LXN0_9ACTN|nr:L,D-transpeptidase [Nocardioides antri]KAA1425735.1 L,D-transpeptidase family protein [Nocardioides antri]